MTGYAVTAQYYDPLTEIAHGEVERRIASALAGLDCRTGPIVDIGAGTGLTTALIARTLPDAEIFAVEPDPAMRPALMTRLWSNPDLRQRATILPFGLLEAPLPGQIAGAVASASLTHFSPAERNCLWALLARKLAPGGRIVVEVQCPEAIDIPEVTMAQVSLGRMTYTGTASAKKIGSDRQRWHMQYLTVLDGQELRCEEVIYDCWTASASRILNEARAAGLNGEVAQDIVVLTSG